MRLYQSTACVFFIGSHGFETLNITYSALLLANAQITAVLLIYCSCVAYTPIHKLCQIDRWNYLKFEALNTTLSRTLNGRFLMAFKLLEDCHARFLSHNRRLTSCLADEVRPKSSSLEATKWTKWIVKRKWNEPNKLGQTMTWQSQWIIFIGTKSVTL